MSEPILPHLPSRIPPHAKCVFRGVIFNVYQWEQKDFQGGVQIFEALSRPDTASIIPVTEDGRIIYSFQEQPGSPPFLSTIGGRVDEGENALEAAKRELLEESGYGSDDWILLDADRPAGKIEWTYYTFIARGCRPIAEQSLDSGEKIELRYATFDEFIRLVTQEDFREVGLKIRFLEALLDPAKMTALRQQIMGKE